MDYDLELEFARNLAKDAGGIIRLNYQKIGKYELKRDESPVTEVDRRINRLAWERVKKHFPDDGFDGEEGSYGITRWRKWLCDPIDGTQMFNELIAKVAFDSRILRGEREAR